MTPFRVLMAMTVLIAFALLRDYNEHLRKTHPFDLSREQTVTKINGVPAAQVPGRLTGASGMFKQRLAPFNGDVPVTTLLYPSGRPDVSAGPAAPPAIAPPPVPPQVAAR